MFHFPFPSRALFVHTQVVEYEPQAQRCAGPADNADEKGSGQKIVWKKWKRRLSHAACFAGLFLVVSPSNKNLRAPPPLLLAQQQQQREKAKVFLPTPKYTRSPNTIKHHGSSTPNHSAVLRWMRWVGIIYFAFSWIVLGTKMTHSSRHAALLRCDRIFGS